MPSVIEFPSQRVRAVRATPVEVPLNFVLGTSAGVLRQVPLLTVMIGLTLAALALLLGA